MSKAWCGYDWQSDKFRDDRVLLDVADECGVASVLTPQLKVQAALRGDVK